ncbi:hypothetical protein N665_0519s0019 [Sinapis alba]|nr:hypothetical protein N665_0519s0019 [Sinapis alba]
MHPLLRMDLLSPLMWFEQHESKNHALFLMWRVMTSLIGERSHTILCIMYRICFGSKSNGIIINLLKVYC